MTTTWANKSAAVNHRPALQSDGSDSLSAILAADRAFPAAVAGAWAFGGNEAFAMKHLLSSPDSAQIGLVQSLLDANGIPYELRNEAVSQAAAGLPFMTELWVLRDEEYEEARRLIQSEDSACTKPE
jgi:hypothetical protein